MEDKRHLISIIVQHKLEQKVLSAIEKSGAKGAAYFYGQGTGIRQKLGILGFLVEQEKVVIMTVVPESGVEKVTEAARAAAQLDKPGNGILKLQYRFVQTVLP